MADEGYNTRVQPREEDELKLMSDYHRLNEHFEGNAPPYFGQRSDIYLSTAGSSNSDRATLSHGEPYIVQTKQIELDCLQRKAPRPKPQAHPDDTKDSQIESRMLVGSIIAPSSQPTSVFGRISTYLLTIGALSLLALLGTIVFITFLWYGTESNSTWHLIVHEDWMTRTVTLLALALRTAISVQAGIATSMLASLAVEHTGVRLVDAPAISIARFSNSGPLTLLSTYIKQPTSIVLLPLLAILALSTVTLQFSSTLLLSDVVSASIKSFPSNTTIAYGYQWYGFEDNFRASRVIAEKYRDALLVTHPSFGEHWESSRMYGEVDDTGAVIRSFIPEPDQSARESLHSYEGPAFTFDSRVTCTQPVFSSLRRCQREQSDSNTSSNHTTLCGNVTPRHKIQNSVLNLTGVEFECLVPSEVVDCLFDIEDVQSPRSEGCGETSWTACGLNVAAGGLMSSLDPTTNDSLKYSYKHSYWEDDLDGVGMFILPEGTLFGSDWTASSGGKSWPIEVGNAFLLFNATSRHLDHVSRNGTIPLNHSYSSGPWTKSIYNLDDLYELNGYIGPTSFRASICYDALPRTASGSHFHFENIPVTLTRNGTHKEPSTRLNVEPVRYDTADLRSQRGTTKNVADPEQRGLLQLAGEDLFKFLSEKQAQWVPPAPSYSEELLAEVNDTLIRNWYGTDSIPARPWLIEHAAGNNIHETRDFISCIHCDEPIIDSIDSKRIITLLDASLFNDIINDTDSPALALQSYLTSTLQRTYYSYLPFFNQEGDVSTTSFMTRLAPTSYIGYWIVMGLIAVHVTVCSITVFLFTAGTKHSFLGSAWSAFAQIANSKETRAILATSTLKTDEEVRREIKATEGMRRKYHLVSDPDGHGATLMQFGTERSGPRRRMLRSFGSCKNPFKSTGSVPNSGSGVEASFQSKSGV